MKKNIKSIEALAKSEVTPSKKIKHQVKGGFGKVNWGLVMVTVA